jgi:hypothetical protein
MPSVLVVRPPKDSLAGFWSTLDADQDEVLFRIDTYTHELVMDVHITYIIDDGGIVPVTLASASGFTGIAALRLPNDGDASDFVPQGLSSTFLA